MRAWTMLVVLLIAVFTPVAAQACSVFDYFQPSNFEIVQDADAIVVATAMREISGQQPMVEFRVDQVVKGPAIAKFTNRFARIGQTQPSDPNVLDQANPEAYFGSC